MPAPPLSNTLDGGTNTGAITTANSGGGSGDAFTGVVDPSGLLTYSNVQARGTLSMRMIQPATTDDAWVRWQTLGSLTGDLFNEVYIWLPSNPSSAQCLVQWRDSGGVFLGRIQINTTGTVQLRAEAVGAIATTTATIALSQWIRIEARFRAHATLGQAELKLFNTDPEATSPTETISASNVNTANAGAGNIDEIRVGSVISTGGSPSTTTYYDNIAVATDTWIGPAGSETHEGTSTNLGAGANTSDARRIAIATYTP
jgi:hypothetical protein